MYKITWVLLFFMLVGCQELETKKVFSNDIATEELKHINWSNVETYPSFPACENCESKTEQRRCFEKKITEVIYQDLSMHQVVLQDSLQERVMVYISVSAKGKVSLDSLKASKRLQEQIPEFKHWLQNSIKNLPQTFPAQKRGIPVNTSFQLPLKIQSE